MALDVYFRQDIKQVLQALLTSAEMYPDRQYQAGYAAAILAVALAFGIDTQAVRRVSTGKSGDILEGAK